jgi:hypothetical protein
MPSDIRDILRAGAAEPQRPAVMSTLMRRANRLRWSRRVLAASTALVVAGGTWAAAHTLNTDGFGRGSAPSGRDSGLCFRLQQIQQNTELSVFLRDDVTEAELLALLADLEGTPGVIEVTYVSREQAFEDFKELYNHQPEYYENLNSNALPASIGVDTEEGTDLGAIDAVFQGAPGVDDVRYGGEIIENLETWCNE